MTSTGPGTVNVYICDSGYLIPQRKVCAASTVPIGAMVWNMSQIEHTTHVQVLQQIDLGLQDASRDVRYPAAYAKRARRAP